MRRLLWLGVGLAVGALAVRAVTKKARQLTPAGLASSAKRSAGGFAEQIRLCVDDVREGMVEREDQLHAAFVEGEAMHGDADGLGDFYVEEGNYR
jgi:hypothetical protein